MVKGLDFSTLIGYSAIKEFFSPNYDVKNDMSIGDYRNTLYWNPFIIMDKKTRRVIIPFFNFKIIVFKISSKVQPKRGKITACTLYGRFSLTTGISFDNF